MEGYSFKIIFRSLLHCKQFQNPKILKVWIWCLLKATDNPFTTVIGLQTVSLEPGQFVYGEIEAAEQLNMPRSTVRACMQWLKKDKSINIKPTTKFSIITITNDAKYREILNEMKNKRTSNEEQTNTYNKNKEEKEYICPNFDLFWAAYPRKEKRKESLKIWRKLHPPEELFQKMMSALKKQLESDKWRQDKGQFIPLSTTWLEGARWEDKTEIELPIIKQPTIGIIDDDPEERKKRLARFHKE